MSPEAASVMKMLLKAAPLRSGGAQRHGLSRRGLGHPNRLTPKGAQMVLHGQVLVRWSS